MAQWLNWGKGTSGSPNSISGTINTYATCTGTAGQTSLTTALSASAGDQILIHQSQGTGAGTWEICKVTSDAGSTLNLATALANSYSTGAQAVLIPQYTGGNISGAVTGTAWNGSVGGIIALMSNGDLTVSGTLAVNGGNGSSFSSSGGRAGAGTGGGFRGGNGYTPNSSAGPANQGEGTVGAGTTATTANGNGGGGGNDGTGGGGGNGAAGSNGATGGTPGTGGSAVGAAALTTMCFGGGGGGGSKTYSYQAAGGGSGGGVILVIAKSLTVSGSLTVNAGNGGSTDGFGFAGGGGGGGSILVKAQSAVLGTNKLLANAGSGGTGERAGGAGGVGRIRCDYLTSVSGSTTPALSSAQDLTLNVAGGSGFFNFF